VSGAEFLVRCSSLGRLMTEPKTKGEGILSVGAKTLVREMAAQEIFGVNFEVSSKQMEKGIRCEGQSIALLNRVRGLSLEKNAERRTDGYITGECDLFYAPRPRGHDLKTSWSISTFPICVTDCQDKAYEFQMRGYMKLWDADEWEVNYALVNTPEDLIGYEPQSLHFVDHIPEHHRITTWVVKRDAAIEALIVERVKAARQYYAQVIEEFDLTHRTLGMAPKAAASGVPTELPTDIFN
jgi:hypothetical protein